MARFSLFGAAGLALVILVGACFGPAIAGRQFAYRDAAHYYYPLYQKVQTEWEARRIPLWETEENSGMPLLGNPTAAVLYPGKLIYTCLPYALAARVYVMAHTLLAFVGMVFLARNLGIGTTGSMIAGLSYAFGAPILFQYCNIIYLVGAAWVPWGFRAIDRWLRLGNRWGVLQLAIVLAMQVLGGEPQAAYLEGLCAGGYAILLSRDPREHRQSSWAKIVGFGLLAMLAIAVWAGLTFYFAHYLAAIRPKKIPVPTFVWNKYVPKVVAACWALVGLYFGRKWIKGFHESRVLGSRFTGLAIAAVLAASMSAAQLLPVLEYTSLTGRAADEGSHDIYPFSLEPYRVAELVWPNVFGTLDQGNRSWLNIIPPDTSHRIWVSSLYLGGATIALALSTIGFRGGPPWRKWLTAIALLTLLASFGEFAGPLWIGRFFKSIVDYVGPHDPPLTNSIRMDGGLRDGDGSFYWFLSTTIPGFQQFRYPSKLLTFTVAALTLLAGYGWDKMEQGDRKRTMKVAVSLTLLSGLALFSMLIKQKTLLTTFSGFESGSLFGPFDPSGAVNKLRESLIQGLLIFGMLIVVLRMAGTRPRLANAIILLLIAGDMALANRHLVMTADQSDFERTPRVLEIIAEAEKANPASGPYRIHRMPLWHPQIWNTEASTQRHEDFVRWERESIQPKYGLPYGISYTHTQGVAELFDYDWFFGPFLRRVEPEIARQLRLADPDEEIVYYPRRGFDLWNTRYFILPAYTPLTNAERGVLSLTDGSERIFPKADTFAGPDEMEQRQDWLRTKDYQIYRNPSAFPRSWIVHDVRLSPPVEGLTREARDAPMTEMLYANDRFWRDSSRNVFDLYSTAYVEIADPAPIQRFRTKGATDQNETVMVYTPSPQRVELDVSLNRPGFVILSEVFYPGWSLTIDGEPAPILRANRVMRGAAVESGKHKLVYEYQPISFAIGKVVSAVGLIGFSAVCGWAAWWRRPRIISEPSGV